MLKLLSLPENRTPDPDVRSTERDRRLEIAAHTHAKTLKTCFFRKLRKKREMHSRFFIDRRDAHQPDDRELQFYTAEIDEGPRLTRHDTGLLRFFPSIDLYEKFEAALLS